MQEPTTSHNSQDDLSPVVIPKPPIVRLKFLLGLVATFALAAAVAAVYYRPALKHWMRNRSPLKARYGGSAGLRTLKAPDSVWVGLYKIPDYKIPSRLVGTPNLVWKEDDPDPQRGKPVQLSAEQFVPLQSLLLDEGNYDFPALIACMYSPDVEIKLMCGGTEIRIDVCLSCGEIVVFKNGKAMLAPGFTLEEQSGPYPQVRTVLTESRCVELSILKVIRKAFPDDAYLREKEVEKEYDFRQLLDWQHSNNASMQGSSSTKPRQ